MNNERRKLVLTVAACVAVQLCGGIIYLWSIFKTPAVRYYNWTDSASNMVSSFMLLGFVLGNLIGGFLQDKTNPRLIAVIGVTVMNGGIFLTSFLTPSSAGLIYLTYCALGGIGSGFSYASVIACLQKWFSKRRGLASGIAVSSFALSTVIFAPLFNWMLNQESFGSEALPKTFLIVSIAFFLAGSVSCFFISLPKGTPQNGDKSQIPPLEMRKTEAENLTPKEALKRIPFWCIVLTTFFANATWNILLPLVKDLGQNERGLTVTLAVLTVTLTGIANSGGRFFIAAASDKINRVFILIILSALTTLCALAMIGANGYFYMVVICIIAFTYGGPASIFPAMTAELCGTKHMGANYGIVLLGLGFSSVVFNFLSGILYNTTGSYTASFILAAATSVISILFLSLFDVTQRKKHS